MLSVIFHTTSQIQFHCFKTNVTMHRVRYYCTFVMLCTKWFCTNPVFM